MSQYTDITLCQAMTDFQRDGHRLAVLVVDEQDPTPNQYQSAQQRVLAHALILGLPVFQIETNPTVHGSNPQPNLPTNPILHSLHARVITKPGLSAFRNAVPDLGRELQLQQINMLVVMGYSSEQCVKLVAVGGPLTPTGSRWAAGATQLGYTVLTSDAVIRTHSAFTSVNWKLDPGVRFYARA